MNGSRVTLSASGYFCGGLHIICLSHDFALLLKVGARCEVRSKSDGVRVWCGGCTDECVVYQVPGTTGFGLVRSTLRQ